MTRLDLRLLGAFQATYNGGPPNFRSDKIRALLAYLAVESGRPHRREGLAGLLWGSMSDANAETNLRLSLSRLRKSLSPVPHGDSLLSVTPESVQFNSSAECWLDTAAMAALIGESEAHLHRSMTACQPCLERLRQAVELYRGEFLSGFFLEDCPEFEQWVLTKREEFNRRALEALDTLADYHERRGEYDNARRCAERELALSRWSESAHRRLMRVYAFSGRRDLALAQYDTCRHILENELGVEPDEKTTALYKQIQGGQLRSPHPAFLNNLPAPLTSFIGRQTELTRMGELLANPACRLVTLIGPGGVGKTRLALQAAANLADGFEQGAYFIPLASLRDANLVPQAFAQALNLKDEPNRPLVETVKDHLRERQLLLVVDNFEQILDAAPLVTEILRECPQVAAIATSREALRVYGEMEFAVPPLDTPDLKRLPDAETLRQYSALELFLDRAHALQSHIALTDDNAVDVAEVCVRLDGIPLAIELAAARCREFSPRQILDQLHDAKRMRVLNIGPRDVAARQQTLRGAIDWSYELLNEKERALFARLSVFAGGWTLEAAESVASPTGVLRYGERQATGESRGARHPALATSEILDLLTRLAAKSLIVPARPDAEPRWAMLETIREYAGERLSEAGEEEIARDRHLRFFLNLAETAEQNLNGAGQLDWLNRLERDHDNLRAALGWTLERGEAHSEPGRRADTALRLGIALGQFWEMRGYLSEGRQWLSRVVEAGRAQPVDRMPIERRARFGQALNWVSELTWRQGDCASARELAEEALTLFRALDDKRGMAGALNNLGNAAYYQSDYAQARMFWEESLMLARESSDKRITATALNNLGAAAFNQGEYARAQEHYQQSLSLRQASGDKRGMANSLNNLGFVTLYQGDYAQARALLEEGLSLARELGDKRGTAASLDFLGTVAFNQGDYARARALYEESLTIRIELGDQLGVGALHFGIGRVALAQSDFARARALFEECLTLWRRLGTKMGEAESLNNLGLAALSQGDYTSARSLLEEALSIRRAVGQRLGIAYDLAGLARLALVREQPPSPRSERLRRAAILSGAVKVLLDATGACFSRFDQAMYDDTMSALRAQLGKAPFNAAWAEGQRLTMEQAVALALD